MAAREVNSAKIRGTLDSQKGKMKTGKSRNELRNSDNAPANAPAATNLIYGNRERSPLESSGEAAPSPLRAMRRRYATRPNMKSDSASMRPVK